jgi:hypothetical protein
LIAMSDRGPRRASEIDRSPLLGWKGALSAAFLLLAGLSPGGSVRPSLPDSVIPCVPCHDHGERDQVAEWLDSPYSETEGGRGCTDCHATYCSGSETPPDLAAAEPLRSIEAARLMLRVTCTAEEVTAEVAVSNVGAGHLLPTGSTKRNLLLEVAAHDRNEAPLPRWNDPDPAAVKRATASPSARAPANGTLPGAAVTVRPRLLPFATDVSRYRFVAPEAGPVRVTARLVLVPVTGSASEIANVTTECRRAPTADSRDVRQRPFPSEEARR